MRELTSEEQKLLEAIGHDPDIAVFTLLTFYVFSKVTPEQWEYLLARIKDEMPRT